ncbi:MAG: hypothetical protein OXH38_00810 [Chloroflexi bacterium]|nr:hypothetical protein [Chloroflexota bacterium]
MVQNERTTVSELPDGWTESRIRAIIDYYDSQTDEEAIAEAEAAYEDEAYTVMLVPCELVPEVQALISASGRSESN